MNELTMNDLITVYFALAIARLLLDAPKVVWILRMLPGSTDPKYDEMSEKKAKLVRAAVKDGKKMLGDFEREGLSEKEAGGVMAFGATLFVVLRAVAWPYFLICQIKRKLSGAGDAK